MAESGVSWAVRRANAADIPRLLELRKDLVRSRGRKDEALIARMVAACRTYFERAIPAGEFLGWLAEADGKAVGTAGLVIHSVPPTVRNLPGREGYIMNMYVVPEWRRHGIARDLLVAVLDFLRAEGVPQVSLHATPDGRHLYEQSGFADSHELRLRLAPPD